MDFAGILDSIEKGKRVSEAAYGVIEDPVSLLDHRRLPCKTIPVSNVDRIVQSQSNLLKLFAPKPKVDIPNDD